jgi:monoamine oxidase
MMHRTAFIAITLALLTLTGCRTYGGYGTEQETYNQMQQANRQYAADLERARADLKALEEAARVRDTLATMVDRYRQAVQTHEARLEQHRSLADRLSESSSYRTLHRVYGSVIKEQQMTRSTYQRMHQRVRKTVGGPSTAAVQQPNEPESGYFVAPLHYRRIEGENNLITMREALRGVGTPSSGG